MDVADHLRQVVTMLATGIGVRTYRHRDQLDRAADYISGQFASFGYQVTKQPVLFAGNTYHNVIAELRGTDSPEKLLIVGAHYDAVRTTLGADDNASGVAGLLGLAQALSGKKLGKTLRFVSFALEEWPVYRSSNMASYQYARSLKEKNEDVEGMICLEMLGFFSDAEGSQHYPFPLMNRLFPKIGNFIALVGNVRSKGFTEQIAASFKKTTDLPCVMLNAPAIVMGIDFSDHWSFNKFGYKALMVTDTAFYRNPHYHALTDLPETLDYVRMAKVVQGLTGSLEEWGNG
jgi:Zn-dependent M28 family amino/carboxypeptidase